MRMVQNWRQVYRLGWIGLGTQFALMLPLTLCMIFYSDYIVGFYSSDRELTALAAKVLSFAAYAILLMRDNRLLHNLSAQEGITGLHLLFILCLLAV